MKIFRRKNIWITVGICAGIGILLFVFFWLLPKLFQEWISEEAIEAFLAGTSDWDGLVYLAFFQAAQVLSVFFPGMAVQIAGGLVFGAVKSSIVCLVSFVTANVVVFALARRRALRGGNSGNGQEKQVQAVLNWINSSDPGFMCMLAYMMPGIPNGFVPYAAVHTQVSLKRFAASVTEGSCIQILMMCSIGSRIMAGDFAISFFLVLGSIVLIFVLYMTKDRIIAYRQKTKKVCRELAEKRRTEK